MRTRTIPLADLYCTAKARPAGYIEDILSHALWTTDTHYALSEEDWLELRDKYTRPWILICRKCRNENCHTFAAVMQHPCRARKPEHCPERRF